MSWTHESDFFHIFYPDDFSSAPLTFSTNAYLGCGPYFPLRVFITTFDIISYESSMNLSLRLVREWHAFLICQKQYAHPSRIGPDSQIAEDSNENGM